MMEIRTEYQVMDGSETCGYVIHREDPRNYWIGKDLRERADWVVFRKKIPLEQAIACGIVRPSKTVEAPPTSRP